MKTKRFNIDLHVHTRRYSPCAETLEPYELSKAMLAKNVGGVVITEHDLLWEEKEINELNRSLGPDMRVYRGVEITAEEAHLVVIGATDIKDVRPRLPAREVIRAVRQQGAAVILAHPFLAEHKMFSLNGGNSWLQELHALEVASSLTVGDAERKTRLLAYQKGLMRVAGSDAHSLEKVGATYTSFPRPPAHEQELAQMIMAGIGVPVRNFVKHAG